MSLDKIHGRVERMRARLLTALATGNADDAAWAARLLARAATIEAAMLQEVR